MYLWKAAKKRPLSVKVRVDILDVITLEVTQTCQCRKA